MRAPGAVPVAACPCSSPELAREARAALRPCTLSPRALKYSWAALAESAQARLHNSMPELVALAVHLPCTCRMSFHYKLCYVLLLESRELLGRSSISC